MSSTIRLAKCCIYCGQEFTAKTVKSCYCSHACNRKDYKKTERDQQEGRAKVIIKVEPLNLRHDPVNWDGLTRKPFLTFSGACLVLNVRMETLRRWIKEGVVKTVGWGRSI
jgi:hypothetical protein